LDPEDGGNAYIRNVRDPAEVQDVIYYKMGFLMKFVVSVWIQMACVASVCPDGSVVLY
jgi:hypothetical protein